MTNIVLIGMSGAGKSTLGVLLAKVLNKDFVDTDIVLQQKYQMKLDKIIEDRGLDVFKRYEEEALCQIDLINTVIATGGSAIYSHKAMEHLSKNAIVVFIHVDYEHLAKRIGDIKSRGIVIEPTQTFQELYELRLPLYKQYAHVTVCVTDGSVEGTLDSLIEVIRKEDMIREN